VIADHTVSMPASKVSATVTTPLPSAVARVARRRRLALGVLVISYSFVEIPIP
jgi:hypothetical protein